MQGDFGDRQQEIDRMERCRHSLENGKSVGK